MAGKISDLTEITTTASGDFFETLDVSDTSGGSSGTNKKITQANLISGLATTASPTFTGTVTIPTPFTLGAVSVLPTGTELNFVDGVTSPIQTQIDTKAPTASPTFTGTVSVPASNFTVGASTPFSDSAGTLTLTNVDALDATTESTIESAIDTLANLTSIQGNTVTLTGAFIRSGAHSLTLTTTNTTSLTLPTTGTLATLAGSEVLSSKTLTLPALNGSTHAYTVDTDGATVTFTLGASNWHSVILGGNRTLALSGLSVNQIFMIDLIQDGTGSRTVTWFPSNSATATVTIAAPGVLTTGVDIPTLTPIVLTTTGALPTGLTASTVYYYTRVDATTGKLSTTVANAQAGTFITTSGTQSGTHTCAVQIRWPSQTIPTLSTGKFIKDTFGFRCLSTGVIDGIIVQQGG